MRFGSSGLLLFVALCAGQAHAQLQECPQRLPQVLRDAYGAAQAADIDVERVVCKVWPAQPELTLVAVPRPRVDNGDDGETDLEILVADSATGKVRLRRLEKGLLDWDAIYVSGISLDTARYRLRDGQPAFGVRVSRSGSSRPNPFGETFLNLYVIDGSHVRPVLDHLRVERSNGEWDTRCAGEFSASTITLEMGDKPGRDGFRDLLLLERRVENRREEAGGACKTVDERKQAYRHRLVYDGQGYPLAKELRGLD